MTRVHLAFCTCCSLLVGSLSKTILELHNDCTFSVCLSVCLSLSLSGFAVPTITTVSVESRVLGSSQSRNNVRAHWTSDSSSSSRTTDDSSLLPVENNRSRPRSLVLLKQQLPTSIFQFIVHALICCDHPAKAPPRLPTIMSGKRKRCVAKLATTKAKNKKNIVHYQGRRVPSFSAI